MCRLLSLLLGHLVWPSQWSDRHVSQSLECIVCYTPFSSTVGYQPWRQWVASLNSCNTAAISLMGGLFSIIFHMHLVTLDTSLRQHLWFSGPIFFGEHPCSGSFLIGPPLTCEGEQELVVLIVNHLKWLSCQTTWLCQELWMYLEIFRHAFGHCYCEGQYPTLCPLLYRDAFSFLSYLHWSIVHNKQWKSWGNWAELGTFAS